MAAREFYGLQQNYLFNQPHWRLRNRWQTIVR